MRLKDEVIRALWAMVLWIKIFLSLLLAFSLPSPILTFAASSFVMSIGSIPFCEFTKRSVIQLKGVLIFLIYFVERG